MSRAQAEALVRPLAQIDLGRRIGQAAAAQANASPEPTEVKLPGQMADKIVTSGEIREFLVGVRPTKQLETIPQDPRAIPVLGTYDVVVIGGGTGGAPAGIAAARQGAKTLVVEYQYGLGGVGTLGAGVHPCNRLLTKLSGSTPDPETGRLLRTGQDNEGQAARMAFVLCPVFQTWEKSSTSPKAEGRARTLKTWQQPGGRQRATLRAWPA